MRYNRFTIHAMSWDTRTEPPALGDAPERKERKRVKSTPARLGHKLGNVDGETRCLYCYAGTDWPLIEERCRR
jgi:hypothetical protein